MRRPSSPVQVLFFTLLASPAVLSLNTGVAAAQAPAPAVDCNACRTYPSSCKVIDTCIKSCRMAPFQAYNCYKAGYLNKDKCSQLFPDCAKTEKCDGCNAFPTLCGKVDVCLKECNVAAVQAQNCFQSGKIDEAKCKQLYPQCKGDDPKCASCRSFPTICGTIDKCIKECNVAAVQAQNCFQSGRIDEAKCKQLYPQCQKK